MPMEWIGNIFYVLYVSEQQAEVTLRARLHRTKPKTHYLQSNDNKHNTQITSEVESKFMTIKWLYPWLLKWRENSKLVCESYR